MKKYCEEFKAKLNILWFLQGDLAKALEGEDFQESKDIVDQMKSIIREVKESIGWYNEKKREMIEWFEQYFKARENKKNGNKKRLYLPEGCKIIEDYVALYCRFDIKDRRIIVNNSLDMEYVDLQLPQGLSVRYLMLEGYYGDDIPDDLQIEKQVFVNSESILAKLWEMKKAGKIKADINPGDI